MSIVVYVAVIMVFIVYARYFLVEQLNPLRLVTMALTILAVAMIVAIAVKRVVKARKLEKYLV
jgi:type VI protein secretion system component VasK